MNPGYFSFISCWFLLIFLWMGIGDTILKDLRVSRRIAIFLLFLTWLGSFAVVPLSPKVFFNVGGWLIPFLFSWWLWSQETALERLHLFSAGMLIGVTLCLAREVLLFDPVLMVVDEIYLLAGLAVFLSLIAVRKGRHQFFVVTMGLIIGQFLYNLLYWEKINMIFLGDGFFRDLWWMSLLSVIIGQWLLTFIIEKVGVKKSRTKTSS